MAPVPVPRAADAGHFRQVFSAEFAYVWATLRRLGVKDRDLEDVAQEVFLQIYNNLHVYDARRPIRPWLFAFAFRAASDYRRLARHRVEVIGQEADVSAPGPLAEEALSTIDEAKLVSDALESIDLDRRAILLAYEVDELPMKEVATALGIALNTA